MSAEFTAPSSLNSMKKALRFGIFGAILGSLSLYFLSVRFFPDIFVTDIFYTVENGSIFSSEETVERINQLLKDPDFIRTNFTFLDFNEDLGFDRETFIQTQIKRQSPREVGIGAQLTANSSVFMLSVLSLRNFSKSTNLEKFSKELSSTLRFSKPSQSASADTADIFRELAKLEKEKEVQTAIYRTKLLNLMTRHSSAPTMTSLDLDKPETWFEWTRKLSNFSKDPAAKEELLQLLGEYRTMCRLHTALMNKLTTPLMGQPDFKVVSSLGLPASILPTISLYQRPDHSYWIESHRINRNLIAATLGAIMGGLAAFSGYILFYRKSS